MALKYMCFKANKKIEKQNKECGQMDDGIGVIPVINRLAVRSFLLESAPLILSALFQAVC